MANTNIADVIDWIATQVVATAPPIVTAPTDTAFVRATPALESFADNPGTIFKNHDRQFEIRLTGRRELDTFGSGSDRQVEQGFEVEVMYVQSLARAGLEARMGRDAEAIENRLANRTGNPAGVILVLPRSSAVRRASTHPDKVTQVLGFTVQYQLSMS